MKNIKLFLAVCGILTLFTSIAAKAADVLTTEAGIYIDNEEIVFYFGEGLGEPYIDGEGRVQMPVRKIAEAAEAEVVFDGENRVVSIAKGGTEVLVPIGEKYIVVNGARKDIDTAAVIDGDGRTYMPIRAVMEALGYEVEWDGLSRCVYLTSEKAADLHVEGWSKHTYPTCEPSGIDGKFAFVFNGQSRRLTPEMADELAENTIYLYSLSDAAQSEAVSITYEIYKLTGDGEELVYRLPLPPYSGVLEPKSQNVCKFTADFWDRVEIEVGDKFKIAYDLSVPEPDAVSYDRVCEIEFADDITSEYEIKQSPYRFNGTMFTPAPPFGIMFANGLTRRDGESQFYVTESYPISISDSGRLYMGIGLMNVRQEGGSVVEDLTPFNINVEFLRLEGEPYSDYETETQVYSFDIPVYSIYKIPERGRFDIEASWNLKDEAGRLVEPGRYVVRLNLPELIYVRYAGEEEPRPVFMGDPNSPEAEEYGGGTHVVVPELRFEITE